MNPAHTSPEPGLAPCGMKMEPVYADGEGKAADSSLPPGAVKLTSQKQQLLGVRVATVEKAPYTYNLRALGKVAVDERLHLPAECRGGGLDPGGRRQLHRQRGEKGRDPGHHLQPGVPGPQQAYLYMLSSLDRFQATGQETPAQIQITQTQRAAVHRKPAQPGHERPADQGD